MGLFERWHEHQVESAIAVLNSRTDGVLVRGAIGTLIKHPEASPFAIPSLLGVATRHPNPDMRTLAANGLRAITRSHSDPVVRSNAGDALRQIEP